MGDNRFEHSPEHIRHTLQDNCRPMQAAFAKLEEQCRENVRNEDKTEWHGYKWNWSRGIFPTSLVKDMCLLLRLLHTHCRSWSTVFRNKIAGLFSVMYKTLTFRNHASYIYRTATLRCHPDVAFYIFFLTYKYWVNMLHTLHFSLQNAFYFIMLPFWFLYYSHFTYRVLKFKCKTPVPKG
jgi:hypothetical protein